MKDDLLILVIAGTTRAQRKSIHAARFVANVGKEIEGVVKAIGAKQAAHIVNVEMEMVVRELVGEIDGVRSQVDAGHVEPFLCQNAGMPAPAAGDIQQEGTCRG